jgi:hypothetical protein
MSIDFWTTENMGDFWGYVRMLLETVSPGVMLWTAVAAVGILIGIIVAAFRKSSKDEDDDIEFRHY